LSRGVSVLLLTQRIFCWRRLYICLRCGFRERRYHLFIVVANI